MSTEEIKEEIKEIIKNNCCDYFGYFKDPDDNCITEISEVIINAIQRKIKLYLKHD